MIRIEAWTRNPEGTFDVTVLAERGRRYVYSIRSQQTLQKFQQHIRHHRYHAAFALIQPAAEPIPPAADPGRARFHPMDGRKRPDPGKGATAAPASCAGGTYAETCLLIGPDASPLIAPADNWSVTLYPH